MDERYEIRVRGFLGPLLRRTLGDLRIRTMPRQSTIRGRLSDDDLERLLTRLDRSGVQLVCVSRGPSSAPDSAAGGGPGPDGS